VDASSIIDTLTAAVPGASFEAGASVDFATIYVPARQLVETCRTLADHPSLRFNVLIEVTAADYLPREPRFEVVYHLLSIPHNARFVLKLQVREENPRVPTVTGVWPTANWHERETYDFYGIVFTGHPDLTRILLPEEWVGWPLRKDSPLGYQEVAFTHNTPDREKPDPDLKKLAPKKVKYRAH